MLQPIAGLLAGRIIANDISGPQLAERLSRVGAEVEGAERQRIVSGGRTILYLWLPLDSGAAPTRLEHSIELDLLRSSGRERTAIRDVACVVRTEQPIVLDTPLRGGPWVALYDPLMLGGHRTSIYTLNGRARIPARFAIDWVKLADDATRAAVEAEFRHGASSQRLDAIGVRTHSIERYVFVDPADPAAGICTAARLEEADLWGIV